MDEKELRLRALKNNCLRCSVCGWEAHFKRSSLKDDLDHYRNALMILCPKNSCQFENADKRIVPDGYISTYRHTFWQTIEAPSEEDLEAIQRAKEILKKAFPDTMKSMTENALRKRLARQGFSLCKGKDGYGCPGYTIIDHNCGVVYGEGHQLSLEEVVAFESDTGN